MFSTRMVRCSSPRPCTTKTSVSPESSTRSATLVSSSRCRRSRRLRLVTYLPSVPANGEVLTTNCIVSVGSSTLSGGRPSGRSASAIVAPIVSSSMPVTSDDVAGERLRERHALEPGEAEHLVHLRVAEDLVAEHHRDFLRRLEPAASHLADADAPDVARVVERVELAAGACRRRRRPSARGTFSRIVWNSGRRSSPRACGSSDAQPCSAEA